MRTLSVLLIFGAAVAVGCSGDDGGGAVEVPSTEVATTPPATTVPDTTTTEATTTTSSTTTTTEATTTTTTEPPPPVQFTFEGAGSDVIILDEPVRDPLLLRAQHSGSSNFQVTTLDNDGDRLEGLVNEIGGYTGTHAVNFRERGAISFIEVNADGGWVLNFDPITTATVAGVEPGDVTEGTGSDVIIFVADAPTTIDVECTTCESNFQVTAWGTSRRGLVNEIGAYQGRVLVPRDTVMLEIKAGPRSRAPAGDWRITVG